MAFPAQSNLSAGSGTGRGSDGGGGGGDGVSRFGDNRTGHRQTVLLPTGETDDVDVAREAEAITQPDAKPWAHFLAGG